MRAYHLNYRLVYDASIGRVKSRVTVFMTWVRRVAHPCLVGCTR